MRYKYQRVLKILLSHHYMSTFVFLVFINVSLDRSIMSSNILNAFNIYRYHFCDTAVDK